MRDPLRRLSNADETSSPLELFPSETDTRPPSGPVARPRAPGAAAATSAIVVLIMLGLHGTPAGGSAPRAFTRRPATATDTTDGAVQLPLRPVGAVEPLRAAISQQPAGLLRPSTAVAGAPLTRTDVRAIQAVLNRYRDAMSTLDVAAIRSVWPSVNVARLRQQFAAVEEQNLEFGGCQIDSAGLDARATCAGVLESGLRPGAGRPRVQRQRWQFALRKSNFRQGWIITNVTLPPPD